MGVGDGIESGGGGGRWRRRGSVPLQTKPKEARFMCCALVPGGVRMGVGVEVGVGVSRLQTEEGRIVVLCFGVW